MANEHLVERLAGLQDATEIAIDKALYGEPKRFDFVLPWNGVNLHVHYWSGALNENRATFHFPLQGDGIAGEVIPSGAFCDWHEIGEVTWIDEEVFSNLWSCNFENFNRIGEMRRCEHTGKEFPRVRTDLALAILSSILFRLTKKV